MLKNIISNRILFIAVLLISFFGMNLEEGKAQAPCASGYTLVVDTLYIDGCHYEIKFCYKCGLTGPDSEATLYSYRPLSPFCVQTMSDEELFAEMNLYMIQFLKDNCEIRPCSTPPKTKFFINQFGCWKKLSDRTVVACETGGMCVTVYEVCWNGSTLEQTTLGSSWLAGYEPTCNWLPSTGFPTITPPATETPCLRINTNCD